MTRNEALNFSTVSPAVKRAFRGEPERMLLSASVRLYKWTNGSLVTGVAVSPWWSFVESTRLPSGTLAEGFRVAESRAARLQRPHREFARSRAAISGEFRNSMRHLLIIQLNIPAWGFAGQASGQREFASGDITVDPYLANVYFIGGADQVWVPNLTSADVTELPAL